MLISIPYCRWFCSSCYVARFGFWYQNEIICLLCSGYSSSSKRQICSIFNGLCWRPIYPISWTSSLTCNVLTKFLDLFPWHLDLFPWHLNPFFLFQTQSLDQLTLLKSMLLVFKILISLLHLTLSKTFCPSMTQKQLSLLTSRHLLTLFSVVQWCFFLI